MRSAYKGSLRLRRKYTFRIDDAHLVLIKKPFESEEHVACKAIAYSFYKPKYNVLCVEPKVEGRYRPDVAQINSEGQVAFWAECGALGKKKIHKLLRKFRNTHFAFFKWEADVDQFASMVKKEADGVKRSAPVELLFLPKNPARCIREDGSVEITLNDCVIIK
jgi:uncharacterized protein YaeQ